MYKQNENGQINKISKKKKKKKFFKKINLKCLKFWVYRFYRFLSLLLVICANNLDPGFSVGPQPYSNCSEKHRFDVSTRIHQPTDKNFQLWQL